MTVSTGTSSCYMQHNYLIYVPRGSDITDHQRSNFLPTMANNCLGTLL